MKTRLNIKKYFSGLTRNSFLLAAASLFSDISTEMLYPILPIYLTQSLHLSGGIIGIIDGIAQATQNIIQGFSGSLADKLQRRKSIALFGFTLSALAKPFIGLATIWQGVLMARLADRLGSGIRSAPRDALIASSVDEIHRGKAFGLEGFGDNLGAFLGPLLTIFLFFTLQLDIRYIFYYALAPGLLALLMIALVQEPLAIKIKSKIELKIQPFPGTYKKYLAVAALFGLGNSSNAFLILLLKEQGMPLTETVLVYALFNLVAALISYPAGLLSDKFGRKPILLSAYIIFFLCYLGLGLSSGPLLIGLLFIFYGLFQGMFRAVGKTLAADLVPKNLQASAVGWYSTVVGLSGLVASLIAGQLWNQIGPSAVFFYGAICSLLGALALRFMVPQQK